MIDQKLWNEAKRQVGTDDVLMIRAAYEALMTEMDVVRAENDSVMATWSDAARQAAAEARRNGIHGETVKPGDTVKFHTPTDEHEATHPMHVLEDRGDRVLVQHNSGFESSKIKPQSVHLKSELMRHQVNASEILAAKRPAKSVAALIDSVRAKSSDETVMAAWSEAARKAAALSKKAHETQHPDDHYAASMAHSGAAAMAKADGDPEQARRHTVDSRWHFNEFAAAGGSPKPVKATDHENDSDFIQASETDVVQCRARFSPANVAAKDAPWKQGEPVTFTYMPAGLHTITAGFRKGSVNLTVLVDKNAAEAAQASMNTWRERMPKQKLYGCVEHREQEASVIAKGFDWKEGEGVIISAEPTALGEQNVNGKIHWGWSPSFTTDADYSQAVEQPKDSGCLVFPDGVRGSATNPARITGIARCVGTLTNNPAFHEMPPVKASEPAVAQPSNQKESTDMNTSSDTITAAWSEAARKASAAARHQKHLGAFQAFQSGGRGNLSREHILQLKNSIDFGEKTSVPLYRVGERHPSGLTAYSESKEAAERFANGKKVITLPPGKHNSVKISDVTGAYKNEHEHIVNHDMDDYYASEPASSADILKSAAARVPQVSAVLRTKFMAALAGDTVKATWSDAAREAAIESRKHRQAEKAPKVFRIDPNMADYHRGESKDRNDDFNSEKHPEKRKAYLEAHSAHTASVHAYNSGDPEAHEYAAKEHHSAAKHYQKIGEEGMSRAHSADAETHEHLMHLGHTHQWATA